MWHPDDPYGAWFAELLAQTGLVHKTLSCRGAVDFSEVDVVLLCGQGELDAPSRDWLTKLVRGGSVSIVACGGTWGLEDVFGLGRECLPGYGRGTLQFSGAGEALCASCGPLTFFGGQRLSEGRAQVLARDGDGRAAVVSTCRTSVVAAHLGKTLALMTMGRGVSNDSVGPGDGSAVLDDGVLRAEDGTNLCFERDRKVAPGARWPAFLTPHADLLRDAYLKLVLGACEAVGKIPVVVWHLPENLGAAFTVTVEGNSATFDHYRRCSALLTKHGCQPGWMVPPPGLPKDFYAAFERWGHDIGHSYEPDGQSATENHVRIQNLQIARAIGAPTLPLVTGKGGAWYGLSRLYELALATEARCCVSKGGRQAGTSGFLFGTARPFVPMRGNGSRISLVELPYQAYRPEHVVPFPVIQECLRQVRATHGVFHASVEAADAGGLGFDGTINQMVTACLELRMAPIRPLALADYELGRRGCRCEFEGAEVSVSSEAGVKGLTLLFGGVGLEALKGGLRFPRVPTVRYGREWTAAVFDTDPKSRADLSIESHPSAA